MAQLTAGGFGSSIKIETFGPNDLISLEKSLNDFRPDDSVFYGETLLQHYKSCTLGCANFLDLCKGENSGSAYDLLFDGSLDFLDYNNFPSECYLLFGVYGLTIEPMASSSSTPNSTGIPLQEFRRDCPPGWSPGLPDYPLRLFFDKLKLWCQIFDGADELVGPLVAGRLQGKAQRLALQLRLPRPDGGVDVGSDALVRLSVDEVRDPTNPAIILQTAIPSGIQSLCNSLRDAFGFSDQELVSKSMEDFMEFRRGRVAFSEFSIEFDMRLEEATTRAGFEINDVAKFYLFFKAAQLPSKLVDDIKLQIQGDLRRFQEARALALRLVHRAQDNRDAYYMGDDDDDWDDSWDDGWYGDMYWPWQDDVEPWMDEWQDDADGWDASWYDEEYYGEDEYYDAESREPSEPPATPGGSSSSPPTASAPAIHQRHRRRAFPCARAKAAGVRSVVQSGTLLQAAP